jgi:hypothetical protein
MIKIIAELLERLKGEENLEQKVWNKIHGEPEGGDYGMWNGVPMTDKRDLMRAVIYGEVLKGRAVSGGKEVIVSVSSMPEYYKSVTQLVVFIHIDVQTDIRKTVSISTSFDYNYWVVEDTRKGMTQAYYEFIEMVGRKIDTIDFLADSKKELTKQALQDMKLWSKYA